MEAPIFGAVNMLLNDFFLKFTAMPLDEELSTLSEEPPTLKKKIQHGYPGFLFVKQGNKVEMKGIVLSTKVNCLKNKVFQDNITLFPCWLVRKEFAAWLNFKSP